MKIDEINIEKFRNYKCIKVDPGEINILYGNNGQGKSNFLEAVYYLGNGFSYRTNQIRDLIMWNCDFFRIEGKFSNKRGSNYQLISILSEKEKKISIDGVSIKKLASLLGNLAVCIFDPDDLMLVKGHPNLRRSFLDREIVIIFPTYYELLRRFMKINYQRNSLLKDIKVRKELLNQLEEWNILYIDLAFKIVLKRLNFLNMLEPFMKYYLEKISGGKEQVKIVYEINELGNFECEEKPNFVKYQNRFSELMKEEIIKGNSLLGPHRDDFKIYLNNFNVKSFGSQGQQRTVALSLKLSCLEIINKELGEYPVLLLDDVMSELDKERRKILTDTIQNKIQTFITTTDLELVKGLNTKSSVYNVIEGSINYVK
ncbi:MAG: DNA replication/repair protein RecF [Bacillota bacterium]